MNKETSAAREAASRHTGIPVNSLEPTQRGSTGDVTFRTPQGGTVVANPNGDGTYEVSVS